MTKQATGLIIGASNENGPESYYSLGLALFLHCPSVNWHNYAEPGAYAPAFPVQARRAVEDGVKPDVVLIGLTAQILHDRAINVLKWVAAVVNLFPKALVIVQQYPENLTDRVDPALMNADRVRSGYLEAQLRAFNENTRGWMDRNLNLEVVQWRNYETEWSNSGRSGDDPIHATPRAKNLMAQHIAEICDQRRITEWQPCIETPTLGAGTTLIGNCGG